MTQPNTPDTHGTPDTPDTPGTPGTPVNRNLPKILIEEVKMQKDQGNFVFLVDVMPQVGECQNCNGGWLHIFIYEYEEQTHPLTMKLERAKIRAFPCPSCAGTHTDMRAGSGLVPAEYN